MLEKKEGMIRFYRTNSSSSSISISLLNDLANNVVHKAAVINPIVINRFSFLDIIILAIVSSIVYIFIQHKKDINKKEGIIMIIMYIIYLVYVVIR